MSEIANLVAREILDSRGRPTVEACCMFASGARGIASVPSGASTGSAEAVELRDGDPLRYGGLGCRSAVANVNHVICRSIAGKCFSDQQDLDGALLELDGSMDKSRLGANAILAVSLAYARAAAQEREIPLYEYFAVTLGTPKRTLPRLTINLFSGGKHGGGQVPLQDVLIVPLAATTIDKSLATAFAVYQAAADLTREKYGMRALTADEGGLAPPFLSVDDMLSDAVEAIHRAGFSPGRDVALAIDVASTHFYDNGCYQLQNASLDSQHMIEVLENWSARFPIISIEDGLAENDWKHWPILCKRLENRSLILGDDLLCTNPKRISSAIALRAANALLVKVNQIGTLSEAAEALRLAREAGWKITVSARSGETEDCWLADLAVGWSADQIKVGSITQSERLAKYNRLLAIETETNLPLVNWPSKHD
jgi:enolase